MSQANVEAMMDFGKLMSEMEVNMAGAVADIVREQNQVYDKHHLTTTCTYFGKARGAQLRSCTRCKAARFCDEECQRADYKARHRRECAEFIHPPRTRSFRTRPVGDEKYPNEPIFGQGHDGLGVRCWVSAGLRMDCQLQTLAPEVNPVDPIEEMRKNRRKDNIAVLVFPSRAQVVTGASSTDVVLRGQVDTYDNVVAFTRNEQKFAAVGVPKDPVDSSPRLDVGHINGQGAREPPYPPGMLDVLEGIVALNPGDFAIMWIQFRIGDEQTINMEWQALRCLEHIIIPFMPWDRVSRPATLVAAIPPAYTLPDLAGRTPHSSAVKHLHVPFNQDAITAHYRDYIEHSEEAYFRTHHGKVHMDLSRTTARSSAALAEMEIFSEGFTPEEIAASKLFGALWAASCQGKI